MKNIVENQRNFYKSGITLDVEYRVKQLKKLKSIIKNNEEKIIEALKLDLNKSPFESYATEIGLVYEEINIMLKNLKKWTKIRKVKSSIVNFPSRNYIYNDPYGVVLVIGPFNYPFMLIVSPLVGAIAAGNTAIIKPSEHSVNTSKVLEKIINENFDEKFLRVVNPLGGKEVIEELLECRFDYIFFTGSIRVGKIVMENAAKNLIPVTLELGGKSPCVVDEDANLKIAAKRIIWGKFLNAGQTCVAPDYLIVNKKIKDKFIKLLIEEIENQFGKNQIDSVDYPRIISIREVERLKKYFKEGKIIYGGIVNEKERYVSPTLLGDIKDGSSILNEEIFGPILPIYEFEGMYEFLSNINNNEKPLALYYFSEDKSKIEYVLKHSTSGGVTINDTVIHVSEVNLPFGGVGNSGMGNYHGKASFDTFTHKKSVLKRATFMELPIRFAPFKNKIKIIRKIMK